MNEFIESLNRDQFLSVDKDTFDCLWNQYERVVLESLLTAFGLDFIKDSYGGEVDTLHNVEHIGVDSQMMYKNPNNAKEYANRGDYSHKEVEGSGTNYQQMKHNARNAYDNDNSRIVIDAYENKPLYFLGKSKNHSTKSNANLDHVISAKTVHDSRGRVLSGLSTKDLADMEENLAWTNESLNKSLGAEDKKAYVKTHPELSQETAKRMMDRQDDAEDAMKIEMIQKYYLDPENPQCLQFYRDTSLAAGKLGVEMGLRQVIGFVMVEVWIVTKSEVASLPAGCSMKDIINSVATGIEKGFKSAISNYQELIAKFGEGLTAGIITSLSTTLCNIFITTSKECIKNIREITASVVRATRVLLLNPDELYLGDRIRMTSVILATGASVLAGTAVGTALSNTAIAKIPVVGDSTVRFCSALVSGLMSCTFLVYMDSSGFINQLIDRLNDIPTEVTDMNLISGYLDVYAAELSKIDVEQFKKDAEQYQVNAVKIINSKDDDELNRALFELYSYFDLPWHGDFDSFMGDRNNKLSFE